MPRTSTVELPLQISEPTTAVYHLYHDLPETHYRQKTHYRQRQIKSNACPFVTELDLSTETPIAWLTKTPKEETIIIWLNAFQHIATFAPPNSAGNRHTVSAVIEHEPTARSIEAPVTASQSLVDEFRQCNYPFIADRIASLQQFVAEDDEHQPITDISIQSLLELLKLVRFDSLTLDVDTHGMLEARWDNQTATAAIMFTFQDDGQIWFAAFDDIRDTHNTNTLGIDDMASVVEMFVAAVSE